ncbi:hypothetical protein GE21DRAFT_1354619 [Neurospora crassa]|nr:hypothetical protein GE21DRAFT_1354619 [Neurospora crassa]
MWTAVPMSIINNNINGNKDRVKTKRAAARGSSPLGAALRWMNVDGWVGWMDGQLCVTVQFDSLSLYLSVTSESSTLHSAVVEVGLTSKFIRRSTDHPTVQPGTSRAQGAAAEMTASNIKHEATTTASGNLPHPVYCTCYRSCIWGSIVIPTSRSLKYGMLATILLDLSGIEKS